MTVLKMGVSDPRVRDLQQMLNLKVAVQPPLRVDGIFGQKTKDRVMQLQTNQRLVPDGIVGPVTARALVAAVLMATLKHR